MSKSQHTPAWKITMVKKYLSGEGSHGRDKYRCSLVNGVIDSFVKPIEAFCGGLYSPCGGLWISELVTLCLRNKSSQDIEVQFARLFIVSKTSTRAKVACKI